MTVTLDSELVAWLQEWRTAQTAEVPFGRALDACIRAFQVTQQKPNGDKSQKARRPNPSSDSE